MPKLKLEFCDIVISLDIADKALYRQAIRRYNVFLTSRSEDLHIDVLTKKGLLSFPSQGTPSLMLLKNKNEVFIKRYDILSTVSLVRKVGSAYLSNKLITLECFLRILFSYIIFNNKNGLLPHSAGIKVNGYGFLFPGMSGAGKTTLYRKAGKKFMLTDELTGIVKTNGRFSLCGTPFMGEFQMPVSRDIVPLQAVFFLKKTPNILINKVAKDDALVKFLATILFFCDDAVVNRKLLKLAKNIIESVPTFELGYDKDRTSFGELLSGIKSVI